MNLKDQILEFIVNNPDCETNEILDEFNEKDYDTWEILTTLNELQIEGKIE